MRFSARSKFSLVLAAGLSSSICVVAAQADGAQVPLNITGAALAAGPGATPLGAAYNSTPVLGNAGVSYTLTVPASNTFGKGCRGYAGVNIPQAKNGTLFFQFGNTLDTVRGIYYAPNTLGLHGVDPSYLFMLQDSTGKYRVSTITRDGTAGSVLQGTLPGPTGYNTYQFGATPVDFAPGPWPAGAWVNRAAIVFEGTSLCNSINQGAGSDSGGGGSIQIFDTSFNEYATNNGFLIPQPGPAQGVFNFSTSATNN